jgi:CheY-like chemotaxis protein
VEQEVERFHPDFIVLDLFMPDMDGIEVLRLLAKHSCAASILMISNYEGEILDQALKLAEGLGLNLAGSLHKPIQLPRLEAALQAAA